MVDCSTYEWYFEHNLYHARLFLLVYEGARNPKMMLNQTLDSNTCAILLYTTTCMMHDYDVQKNSVLYLIIVSGTSKSLHAWWHCLMLASVLLISQTFMFTVSFVYRGYVNFIVDSNCCDPLNVRVSPYYQGMRQCRHWLQFHEDLCPSPVCDSGDSEHIN